MIYLASFWLVLSHPHHVDTCQRCVGSTKEVYYAHRNDEERERGFCGCPYNPWDWPLDDDEPGAHNGPTKY